MVGDMREDAAALAPLGGFLTDLDRAKPPGADGTCVRPGPEEVGA